MDNIEGYNLNHPINDNVQALCIMTDLMSALRVFEKYNIHHNDMNFQNIMYNIKTNKYVVIDFDYSEINNDPNYVNNDSISDIETVNFNLQEFYGFIPENNTEGDIAIDRYHGYTESAKGGLSLGHYISMLSSFLGQQRLILTLEYNQEEHWQYGIKEQ
jgi:hypothetical protein